MNYSMDLESLPNKTLLDLFDYFDGTDLLHAFYGLNSRFNQLLYQQYRRFRFNFRSTSKRQFDLICQQHISNIADRVRALSFSDLGDIPDQIDLFFSYIPSLDHFTHLRSLSLPEINQGERGMKIIDQCHHLCHLTYLKIRFGYFNNFHNHVESILNNIWSLPKLVHCEMNFSQSTREFFHTQTKISLNAHVISSHQINQLLQYTPYLKHLSISVERFANDYLPTFFPTLLSLQIRSSDIVAITLLLRNMPNLHSLDIDILSSIISGDEWRDVIRDYLPRLNKFRFKMSAVICEGDNVTRKMNELIQPFRNSFWIDEHRWFVRCFILYRTVYLCTLSSTFPLSNVRLPDFFISTDSNDDLQTFCNDILDISNESFFSHPRLSNIRLTNIQNLTVHFPLHKQFWSAVPSLNRLHSLTVYMNENIPQHQLQSLLDRAPRLCQLTIHPGKLSCFKISSLKHINASIRQLDIYYHIPYFTEEDCLVLARSPLGAQCEILSIEVYNCKSILVLIHNMSRLRILTILCYDMTCSKEQNVLAADELIQWLKERLPSAYQIITSERFPGKIRISL